MVEALVVSVVTNFLLPYAKDAMKSMADEVTKTTGKAAAAEVVSVGKRVWERVHRLFSAHHQEVLLDDLCEDPGAMTPAVEMRLDKMLKSDPEAKRELEELVRTVDTSSGRSVTSIIGNTGVTISNVHSTLNASPITTTVNHGTTPS